MAEMTLKQVQEISLETLTEFDFFCRDNKLNYYLAWGTLLGAVRHKGFIPWDNDVDVFMPRPDFERFQEIYKDHDNYKLYSNKRQKSYYLLHMKLCDTNTWQKLTCGKREERGVGIDIFAIDGQESDVIRGEKEFERLHRKFISTILRWNGAYYSSERGLKETIKKLVVSGLVFTGIANRVSRKLDTGFSRLSYKKCKRVASTHSIFVSGYLSWEKEVFEPGIQMEFEKRMFYCPHDPDAILSLTYNDYMKLPPVEKRNSTHAEHYYI